MSCTKKEFLKLVVAGFCESWSKKAVVLRHVGKILTNWAQ